ncbi:MAG: hypothetical protein JJT88_18885 [Gammaproteobacteria bacterium]|nr:hypothetical protein [Gammaproteobacteria bacterium]
MSRIDQLREELGGAHPVAATKVKDHLEPIVRGFIEAAPFLVMASSNGEAYLHCPRAFHFAALWDADTIAANRGRPLKSLRT